MPISQSPNRESYRFPDSLGLENIPLFLLIFKSNGEEKTGPVITPLQLCCSVFQNEENHGRDESDIAEYSADRYPVSSSAWKNEAPVLGGTFPGSFSDSWL